MSFHYTVTTDKTTEQVVAALEEHLKEQKFGILWNFDLAGKLKEKGVESYTNPYRILEVCNPVEAGKVLSMSEEAGNFLPCKITVYESEGVTKIGLLKPTSLVSLLDHADIQQLAVDIEQRLIGAIDRSK